MRASNRRLRVASATAALPLLLAGVALAAANSGSYRGTTMQTGHPNGTVNFKVASDHANVKGFQGVMYTTCTKPRHPPQIAQVTLNPTPDMVIHNKKFSFTGKFNINNGPVVIAHNVNGTIGGKFVSNKDVMGTMKFDWTFDNKAPQQFRGTQCTTGTVQFTANHA
jgi:hypothetical protein